MKTMIMQKNLEYAFKNLHMLTLNYIFHQYNKNKIPASSSLWDMMATLRPEEKYAARNDVQILAPFKPISTTKPCSKQSNNVSDITD